MTGAAGAVGGYVVPFALERGWRVTGLARAADEEFVRGLGAEFTAEPTTGWDAVADAAVLQEQAVALVRDGGRFVGVQPSFPPASERGVSIEAVGVVPDGAALAGLLERTATRRAPGPGRRGAPPRPARRGPRRRRQGRRPGPLRAAALTPSG